MLGIIGALDIEVEGIISKMTDTSTQTISSVRFTCGKLNGTECVVAKCGIGKVNAAMCAQTMILRYSPDRIINTGIAGSTSEKTHIGSIVVASMVVQHDFDVEAIGFKKGEIPYTGQVAFPADEALRSAAVEAVQKSAPDIHVFEGRVCSGDKFISTKEQKDTIIKNFGGMCCEMEGAAIAQTCYLNSTPFVIIRAISDKPDGGGSVDFNEFQAEAAARCAAIVQYIVERL